MYLKKLSTLFVFLIVAQSTILGQSTFGHGLNSETLPSIKAGDTEVALFAKIITNPFAQGKQFQVELFDTVLKETAKQTTYQIKATKNNEEIFEEIFRSDNSGLIMDFIPTTKNKTTIQMEGKTTTLEKKMGLEEKNIVTSPIFQENGLYIFKVKILTMNGFDNYLKDSVVFNFGLSVPDIKPIYIKENSLSNELIIISFYDEIKESKYDSEDKSINYEIPFNWSVESIEQSSVVHSEIIFEKNFERLMNSNFTVHVNDKEIGKESLVLDDYTIRDSRIMHLVINQKMLKELAAVQPETEDKMRVNLKINDTMYSDEIIPDWIRDNAGWWAQGQIDDKTFVSSIQYLINQKIIKISGSVDHQVINNSDDIPLWIKNNADWWSKKLISNKDFIKGIKFLIEKGIIKI